MGAFAAVVVGGTVGLIGELWRGVNLASPYRPSKR